MAGILQARLGRGPRLRYRRFPTSDGASISSTISLRPGRRICLAHIVDDVTRECLRAVVDTSISGKRVARELAGLVAERGKPDMIVSGLEDHKWIRGIRGAVPS